MLIIDPQKHMITIAFEYNKFVDILTLTAGLGENTNDNKGIGGKGNFWE